MRLTALAMVVSGVLGFSQLADAQTTPQDQELQRAREREAAIRAQQPKAPDVRSDAASQVSQAPRQLPFDESPAFAIRQIGLIGDDAWRFQFALDKALADTGLQRRQVGDQIQLFKRGRPEAGVVLGANGINELMRVMQNHVIDRGYTTTRILAAPQDLTKGILVLTVIPGRVRHIVFDTENADKTNIHRATAFNAVPIKAGDILNLRDIEQGLENFKRVPTVEADIQIKPGSAPNESDLLVRWMQRKNPFRFNLSLDDAGGDSTGSIQGGATVSWDHPLRLNDLFYVSFGGGVAGFEDVAELDGFGSVIGERHGQSDNWTAHYSVPMGYWLLGLNASAYHYEQAVAGTSQTYAYSGNSRTRDIKLSRIVHRTAKGKTSAYLKGWYRDSENFIDDVELTVQRRRTAGWELGLSHRAYVGAATWDFGGAYRRGTGAGKALRAPEELFGEGTSRMGVYTVDISVNAPLGNPQGPWSLSSSYRGQWNSTPLVQQDKLAIGGRYTVRGFDGELMLSAERGHVLRNEVMFRFKQAHQAYVALDAGRVSGPSTTFILGQNLVGAALGIRGQFKLGGQLNYDLFAGAPLHKPTGFPASGVVTGFNLNFAL